jgi:hypothetical protein
LRYRDTASGAKIAISAKHHTKDIQTSLCGGVPSHSDLIASEIVVNGFASANWRRPSGIDDAGTKIDDANVSGKISVNPIEFAVSGVDDITLQRPTLDDVFIALTGHSAEEEEEEGDSSSGDSSSDDSSSGEQPNPEEVPA